MSEAEGLFEPDYDPRVQPLPAAIQAYDQSEFEFLIASAQYAMKPDGENTQGLQHAVDVVQYNFGDYVDTVLEDAAISFESQAELLSHTVQTAHEKRIAVMSNFTSPDYFQISPVTRDLPDSIRVVLENPETTGISVDSEEIMGREAATFMLHDNYNTSLQIDISAFTTAVQESPQANRVRRHAAFKQHASEIGKIAAGTAAGGLVAGLLLKGFSK